MPKRAKLNTAEIFFVEEKTKAGMSVEEVAQALKLSVELVKPYAKEPVVVEVATEPAPQPESLALQSFIRKTAGGRTPQKGVGGVVVATQAASQHGDDAHKNFQNQRQLNSDCITSTKRV